MKTAMQEAIELVKKYDNREIPFNVMLFNLELLLEKEQKQLKEMYLKGIENYDPTFKRKSQWTEVDNMTRRLK